MAPAAAPTSVNRRALAAVATLAVAQDVLFGFVFLSAMNHYLLDVLHSGPGLPAFTLALYSAAAFAVQPLAGHALDRTSPRLVCGFAMATEIAGLAVIVLLHSVGAFLTGAALLGLGAASFWPVVFAVLAATQPPEARSTATAILSATGFSGTGLGLILGLATTRLLRWQWAFVFAGVPVLLAAVARVSPALNRAGGIVESPAAASPVRRLALLGALVLIDYGALTALLGLYGPYVRRSLDVSLVVGVLLLVPAGACALGAMAATARLSRPSRRYGELAALFLLAGSGALLVGLAPSPAVAMLVAPLLLAGMAGIEPILNAAIVDAGGTRAPGLTFGALLSMQRLGTVAVPAAVGAITQLSTARLGIGLTGLLLAFSAALAATAGNVRSPAGATPPRALRPP